MNLPILFLLFIVLSSKSTECGSSLFKVFLSLCGSSSGISASGGSILLKGFIPATKESVKLCVHGMWASYQ